jgi:hypothetical protein
MHFVRPASLDEVLRATPEDEPSKDVVRRCSAFGIWSFGREDIANAGAQLPSGKMGTISSLFTEGREWLRSSDPRAPWRAALHSGFVHLLRAGQTFAVRPIVLGERMQIHDGRHRLFAAFEFLSEQVSVFTS